jgi:hypothetical protein
MHAVTAELSGYAGKFRCFSGISLRSLTGILADEAPMLLKVERILAALEGVSMKQLITESLQQGGHNGNPQR